jgi:hypothetical protein
MSAVSMENGGSPSFVRRWFSRASALGTEKVKPPPPLVDAPPPPLVDAPPPDGAGADVGAGAVVPSPFENVVGALPTSSPPVFDWTVSFFSGASPAVWGGAFVEGAATAGAAVAEGVVCPFFDATMLERHETLEHTAKPAKNTAIAADI